MGWVLVVGTRPEWVKARALVRAFQARQIPLAVWHTGQHTDLLVRTAGGEPGDISAAYRSLGVAPDPDPFRYAVAVASVIREELKDPLIVIGGTASAYGAALGAAQAGLPIAHVEAGVRTREPEPWPEEAFRIVIDHLSTWRFCHSWPCVKNLSSERLTGLMVGGTGIDDLLDSGITPTTADPLVLITLHRRENHMKIPGIIDHIGRLAKKLPHQFVWPIHPNPAFRSATHFRGGIEVTPPMDHYQFRRHLAKAQLLITDSQGVQEEAAHLGIPTLVARSTTDRPEPIGITARLIGPSGPKLAWWAEYELTGQAKGRQQPAHQLYRHPLSLYGEGQAAPRIAFHLAQPPQKPHTTPKPLLYPLAPDKAAKLTRNIPFETLNHKPWRPVKKSDRPVKPQNWSGTAG